MSYEWDDELLQGLVLCEFDADGWDEMDTQESAGKHDMTNISVVYRAPDGRFWEGNYCQSYSWGADFFSAGAEVEPREKTITIYVKKESK